MHKFTFIRILFVAGILSSALFMSTLTWAKDSSSDCETWLNACETELDYCDYTKMSCQFEPGGFLCGYSGFVCGNAGDICKQMLNPCGFAIPKNFLNEYNEF
jgi:hypothetical protein